MSTQHRTVVRHVDEQQSREIRHQQHQTLVAVGDTGNSRERSTQTHNTDTSIGQQITRIKQEGEQQRQWLYLPKPLLAAEELAFSCRKTMPAPNTFSPPRNNRVYLRVASLSMDAGFKRFLLLSALLVSLLLSLLLSLFIGVLPKRPRTNFVECSSIELFILLFAVASKCGVIELPVLLLMRDEAAEDIASVCSAPRRPPSSLPVFIPRLLVVFVLELLLLVLALLLLLLLVVLLLLVLPALFPVVLLLLLELLFRLPCGGRRAETKPFDDRCALRLLPGGRLRLPG